MYNFFFHSRNTEADTFDDEINEYKREKRSNKIALHICFLLFYTASIEQAIQNEHDKTMCFTLAKKEERNEKRCKRKLDKERIDSKRACRILRPSI